MPVLTKIVCDNAGCSCVPIEFGDPKTVPDVFYKTQIHEDANGKKHVFLTKRCLLEWLKTWEAPKSPAEMTKEMQAAQDEINRKIDKKHTEAILDKVTKG